MKWKLWRKKKEPVVRFPDAAERVARGAALLDAECVGWQWEVNPDKIDLFSYTNCVLGQIYGGYGEGARQLGPAMTDDLEAYGYRMAHYGFSTTLKGKDPWDGVCASELAAEAVELTLAWKREIAARRKTSDLSPRARYIH